MIDSVALNALAFYDTDGNSVVDIADYVDGVHYDCLINACDLDGDNNVDACEMFACVVVAENEYREAVCPDYGAVYCNCPYTIIDECPYMIDCPTLI
jgi:hypothetical protein